MPIPTLALSSPRPGVGLGAFPPAIPSPRVSSLPPTAEPDKTAMPSWWQPLGPALNTWPVGPAQQPAAADNHSTIQLSPRALKEQLAVEKAPAAPSPTEGPRLQTLELENIRMSGALKEQVAKAKEQQVRLQKAAELLRQLLQRHADMVQKSERLRQACSSRSE